MAFYMITRIKFKEAGYAMSDDGWEKWHSARDKALEDAGIKMVVGYRSYIGQGLTFIHEVPSFEAWDKFFRKLSDPKGLYAKRYYDSESDFCYKLD